MYDTIPHNLDSSPDIPVAQLEELAKHSEWQIRTLVASNPSTPPEALDKLASDLDLYVATATSNNPSTPPDTLRRLYENSTWDNTFVRKGLARNPSTPADILFALTAPEEYEEIRRIVAENPSTPSEVLSSLADQEGGGYAFTIRKSLARNPNTAPSVLETLSDDPVVSVRELAMDNPSHPRNVKLKGFRDRLFTVLQEEGYSVEEAMDALQLQQGANVQQAKRSFF